jgi:hypothetical protein
MSKGNLLLLSLHKFTVKEFVLYDTLDAHKYWTVWMTAPSINMAAAQQTQ